MNTIVKSSSKIKEALIARWKELEITQADVIRDVLENGLPMNRKGKGEVNEKIMMQTLSRTLNNGKTGLTEEQLIFICFFYGIEVYLDVVIVQKYNRKNALTKLHKIFPPKKK